MSLARHFGLLLRRRAALEAAHGQPVIVVRVASDDVQQVDTERLRTGEAGAPRRGILPPAND